MITVFCMVVEIINVKVLGNDYESDEANCRTKDSHLRQLESTVDPMPIEDPENPQCNIYNLAL